MTKHSHQNQEITNSNTPNVAYAFLATTIAAYALLKKNNYKFILHRYYTTGGGGITLAQKSSSTEKFHRKLALDFHPVFNQKTQSKEWCLHYHAGKNQSQINKHKVIVSESDVKNLFKFK